MRWHLRALAALLSLQAAWCASTPAPTATPVPKTAAELPARREGWYNTSAACTRPVTIGYFINYNPWKLSLYNRDFELRTGCTIKWVQMTNLSKAPGLLLSDQFDMTVMGSDDIARIFTRNVEAKLVWVEEGIHNSEALIVHNRYHSKTKGEIRTPLDLRGKKIAVKFGSMAHFTLMSYYQEFNVKVIADTVFQRLADCSTQPEGKLIPCHFKNQSDAVNLIGMEPQEAMEAFMNGTVHAAYVGFPQRFQMRNDGTTLLTSEEAAMWGKVTFRGYVATDKFLKLDWTGDFLQRLFLSFARANYYYKNNTKEFQLLYRPDSVSAKIAATIPNGKAVDVQPHLAELDYPTLYEQYSCKWLSCGAKSRIAYSLNEHANVFRLQIKADMNTVLGEETPARITTQNIKEVALVDVIKVEDFAKFIEPKYVQSVLDGGFKDEYHLEPRHIIHLGYQITDIFGPTLHIETADSCFNDTYYSDSDGPMLSDDIKQTGPCVCREYDLSKPASETCTGT